MITLTAKYLQTKFVRVDEILAILLEMECCGRVVAENNLQILAEMLAVIQRSVMKSNAGLSGSMYKAGILTGCAKGLERLNDKYKIEPKGWPTDRRDAEIKPKVFVITTNPKID